jgi:hypothetical protein
MDIRKYGKKKLLVLNQAQGSNMVVTGRDIAVGETNTSNLNLSDRTSDLVRQYDFPVPLRCRKTSDAVFVAFVRPLSEPVRRFSSCSTDFSQQIAQVVLLLILHVFLF